MKITWVSIGKGTIRNQKYTVWHYVTPFVLSQQALSTWHDSSNGMGSIWDTLKVFWVLWLSCLVYVDSGGGGGGEMESEVENYRTFRLERKMIRWKRRWKVERSGELWPILNSKFPLHIWNLKNSKEKNPCSIINKQQSIYIICIFARIFPVPAYQYVTP